MKMLQALSGTLFAMSVQGAVAAEIKLLSDADVWAPSNSASAALRHAQSGELEDARRVLRDGLRRFQTDGAIDASFYWHIVTLFELAILNIVVTGAVLLLTGAA